MSKTKIEFYGAYGDEAGYIILTNNVLHADNEPAIVHYGCGEDGGSEDWENKFPNVEIWYQNGIQFNPNGPSKVKYVSWNDMPDNSDESCELFDHLKGHIYYQEWTDETGKVIKIVDNYNEMMDSLYEDDEDDDEDENDEDE